MRRDTGIAMILLLSAMFFCGGCMKPLGGKVISKSTVTPVREIQGKLKPYETVIVLVKPAEGKPLEKEAAYLEQQIIWQIKNLAVFNDVIPGTGEETLKNALMLKVVVLDAQTVSTAKRMLLSVAAGSISTTVTIVFDDAATGGELGSYSLTAKGIASGSANDALDKAAEGIAKLLEENMGK